MNDVVDQTTLPIGAKLRDGDYKIEQVLGVGGFGVTYLATHSKLQRPVAIKEYMPREFAHRTGDHTIVPYTQVKKQDFFHFGLNRFLMEARDLVRFNHQNIVRAGDYFEENGTAYIVMDYAKGQTLERWLRLTKMAPNEDILKDIFLPLLDGLREVHSHNLLHRDISPDNIYLQESGQPILIDFGAARNQLGTRSQSLGVIIKEGYSPKEQYAANGRQGPFTDIYAVGASIYRAMSGSIPPGSTTRIDDIDHGDPDPLIPAIEQFSDQYSESLLTTVDWCLNLNAAERPQTVKEVQEAIAGRQKIRVIKPPRKKYFKSDNGNPEVASKETATKEPTSNENPLTGKLAIGALSAITLLSLGGALYLWNASDSGTSSSSVASTTSNSRNTPSVSNPTGRDLLRAEAQEFLMQANINKQSINRLNVSLSNEETSKFEQERLKLQRFLDSGDNIEARTTGRQLINDQNGVINLNPRKYEAGSSSRQIESAFDQCVSTIGQQSCAVEWFVPERAVSVELTPFKIESSAVSFGDFQSFVEETKHITAAESLGYSLQLAEDFQVLQLFGYSWKYPNGENGAALNATSEHPVVHVSYTDAEAYCTYLNKRLPTRFEWEYAVSNQGSQLYADYFNPSEFTGSLQGQQEVLSKAVRSEEIYDSTTGIYGGSGNVWEWTETSSRESAQKKYTKGGSWNEPSAVFNRVQSLRAEYTGDMYIDVGFRCAQDLEKWEP